MVPIGSNDVNAEFRPAINYLHAAALLAATPSATSAIPVCLLAGLPRYARLPANGYFCLPGSPRSANRSAAAGVERLLSLALRFFPMFECLRTRRFQVARVFEAMARVF